MTDNCALALKIDVDTLKGYREGLPRLLDMLKRRGIRASIFFSMGPDNSGKAVRRIFRRGFVSKMLRTRAPSTYGLKTLLYGTLLPAPMIVESDPGLLRRAVDEGHDCGVHAWDHVFWQDRLPSLSREAVRGQFARSMELFERVSGTAPACCAAPGWQTTPDALAVQDELGFAYCSDVRGTGPSLPRVFLPRMGGTTFRTPQIPSTLPTLDELWGTDGLDADTVNDRYLDLLEPGVNVHTIHTEMEGGAMSGVFEALLDACLEGEMAFVTLREVLVEAEAEATADGGVASLPVSEVVMREIPGRAGTVAVQQAAEG